MDAPDPSRRSIAAIGSVAVHAALVALAFTLGGNAMVEERQSASRPSPIDIEAPPRAHDRNLVAAASPHGAGGTPVPARSTTSAGRRGGHGHAAVARSQAPELNDPFADVSITYDTGDASAPHPGSDADDDGNGPGRGDAGLGTGLGIAAPLGPGDGGLLELPRPPPPPSLARPPRAKHDYRRWAIRWPEEYGGKKVLLELAIDAGGTVSGAKVILGVSARVNAQAIAAVRHFEFYPALDDAGRPTAGVHRWEFVIESVINFSAALGH